VTRRDRARVLADVAERVALWNEFRTDDFQDRVVRLVNDAREAWRVRGELPAYGDDAMFDTLMSIAEVADSAPTAVRDACADALRESDERQAGAA
jgi:hypothetical protein